MDGGGFMQERDLSYAQISSLSSVHGSTLLNRLFSKGLRKVSFIRRVNASGTVDENRRIIEAVRPFEPRRGSTLVEQPQ